MSAQYRALRVGRPDVEPFVTRKMIAALELLEFQVLFIEEIPGSNADACGSWRVLFNSVRLWRTSGLSRDVKLSSSDGVNRHKLSEAFTSPLESLFVEIIV